MCDYCSSNTHFVIVSSHADLWDRLKESALRGDSGLDIPLPVNLEVKKGETVKVNLQCRVRAICGRCKTPQGYWLLPRSSFTKLPLLFAADDLRDEVVKILRESLSPDEKLRDIAKLIAPPFEMRNVRGVIDSGYLGDLMACLRAEDNFEAKRGTSLFQIVPGGLHPPTYEVITPEAALKRPEFAPTLRGSGGFGSSGSGVPK